MKTIESNLQQACVTWFRLQYPQHARRLFAIPNGGQRSISTAKRLKAEGALAGVWDLFLAVPSGGLLDLQPSGAITYRMVKHGLFIEMKAPKGKLTDLQKEFQQANEADYSFAVCRSFEEFQQVIRGYLQ